jgi:hypothetical protein
MRVAPLDPFPVRCVFPAWLGCESGRDREVSELLQLAALHPMTDKHHRAVIRFINSLVGARSNDGSAYAA